MKGKAPPPQPAESGGALAGLVAVLGERLGLVESVRQQVLARLDHLGKAAVVAAQQHMYLTELQHVDGAVLRVVRSGLAGIKLRLSLPKGTSEPLWADVRIFAHFGELLDNLEAADQDAKKDLTVWLYSLTTDSAQIHLQLDLTGGRPKGQLTAPVTTVQTVTLVTNKLDLSYFGPKGYKSPIPAYLLKKQDGEALAAGATTGLLKPLEGALAAAAGAVSLQRPPIATSAPTSQGPAAAAVQQPAPQVPWHQQQAQAHAQAQAGVQTQQWQQWQAQQQQWAHWQWQQHAQAQQYGAWGWQGAWPHAAAPPHAWPHAQAYGWDYSQGYTAAPQQPEGETLTSSAIPAVGDGEQPTRREQPTQAEPAAQADEQAHSKQPKLGVVDAEPAEESSLGAPGTSEGPAAAVEPPSPPPPQGGTQPALAPSTPK